MNPSAKAAQQIISQLEEYAFHMDDDERHQLTGEITHFVDSAISDSLRPYREILDWWFIQFKTGDQSYEAQALLADSAFNKFQALINKEDGS